MKILVTGANGFVGKALCDYLTKHNHEVFGVGRTHNPNVNVKKYFRVEDYLGYSDWKKVFKDIEVLIHTAGLAHARGRPEEDYYKINTEMTKKLAQEAVASGVKRFVFVSSLSVLGLSSSKQKITSSTPLNPVTPYGDSKVLAEQALLNIENKDFEVVIVRPPVVYGPSAPGNIYLLLSAIKKNCPLPFSSVSNRRSLIGLKNLCDALMSCAISPKAPGKIFLVSDGEDISVKRIIQILAEGLHKSPKLFPFPMTLLKGFFKLIGREEMLEKIIGNFQVDISEIQEELGWNPVKSVNEGLLETAQP